MKAAFSFDFIATPSKAHPRRHSVFFFGKNGLSPADCYLAIDAHYSRHPISDDVTFISLAGSEDILRKALADSRISTRIRQTNGGGGRRRRILVVRFDGTISELIGQSYGHEVLADNEFCETIKHNSADFIFREHHGMLEASESHHYVKPSLKHTNRFMRSGTVLINGVEIDLLAVWLLPFLAKNVRHIYTDSSTINSVAYALVLLRNRLAPDAERIYPTIQSFESYKGLNENTFPDKDGSLVLISASSGGGMLQDIVNKYRIDSNRLCTLYYLGEELPCGKILCNLTRTKSNLNGFLPAVLTKSGDRGQFPVHSLPVHILAEAFLPENPVVEAVQVTTDDIPEWWNSFKHSFIGRRLIRCYSPDPLEIDMTSPPRHPVAIDLSEALRADTQFTSKINRILRTSVPVTLKTVISFEDSGSKSIVRKLKKLVETQRGHSQNIQQVFAGKYAGQNGVGFEVDADAQASCCVICSALTDDTRLLDITQILRHCQKNHAISFVVGLVVSPSSKDFREFKNNICYSQSGVPYPLHIAETIELPRVFRGELTSWDEELRFWVEQLKAIKRQKPLKSVRKKVESRIAQLQSPDGGPGFIDNAFLTGGHLRPLSLRPNSVFTEGLASNLCFSQADIFLAATAVLHNLRTHKDGAGRLEQHPHKRTVISPRLFYRFSDGIIQAAFLRAATGSELNFRMDRSMSKLMGDVLIAIFQKPESPRAEALIEMLYAIALGKLRLLCEDLTAFLDCIEPQLVKKTKFELEKFICSVIREKYLGPSPQGT